MESLLTSLLKHSRLLLYFSTEKFSHLILHYYLLQSPLEGGHGHGHGHGGQHGVQHGTYTQGAQQGTHTGAQQGRQQGAHGGQHGGQQGGQQAGGQQDIFFLIFLRLNFDNYNQIF